MFLIIVVSFELTVVELRCKHYVSSVKILRIFLWSGGMLCNRTIIPRTIITRFDYTYSFLLSSEAAPVAQLQTPRIKPPVILFSGLLTQGAQVSEIKPFLQHTYMWLVYATQPTEMGDLAPFSG